MYFKFPVIHSQYKSTPVIRSPLLSLPSFSPIPSLLLPFPVDQKEADFLLLAPDLSAVLVFLTTMAFSLIPFLGSFSLE